MVTTSAYHSTSSAIYVSTNASCSCSCVTLDVNLTVGSPALQDKIDKLILTTKINKNNTSSSMRSKTSAEDNRPSSKGLGSLGIAMLSVIILSLLAIDVVNIATMIQKGISFLKEQIKKSESL